MKKADVVVVGSGMGSLSAAVLLAAKGLKVTILEQNYLPGGCTSSYWRKGFVFETGATTLVGLDDHMALKYLLDQTGIELETRLLDLPMMVYLSNGEVLKRYQNLELWISEAERVFGVKGQRAFWEEAFEVSQFVWKTSLKQKLFPPRCFNDYLNAIQNVDWSQLKNLPSAFVSTSAMLKKHGLFDNDLFRSFVDEQLMITAQNTMDEVNFLFGATALCYTNYNNYYIDGGLINLVKPMVEFVENNGGRLLLRERVTEIERQKNQYLISTNKDQYEAAFVVSGLPINNTLEIYNACNTKKFNTKLLGSGQLNSAFQMGIGFRSERHFESLHHQVHLQNPLPFINADSIFISLNHPDDNSRCDEKGYRVMSVSTHITNPEKVRIESEILEKSLIELLEQKGFLDRNDIVYCHSSTQKSWAKWTGRKWGFVGGYPQFFKTKPWQMLDARLDGYKAYQVGDSVYPGQGIPGVTLSGILAVEKMSADWKL